MKLKINLEKAIERNFELTRFISFCEKNVDTVFDIGEFVNTNNPYYPQLHAMSGWSFMLGEDLVECDEYNVEDIINEAYGDI